MRWIGVSERLCKATWVPANWSKCWSSQLSQAGLNDTKSKLTPSDPEWVPRWVSENRPSDWYTLLVEPQEKIQCNPMTPLYPIYVGPCSLQKPGVSSQQSPVPPISLDHCGKISMDGSDHRQVMASLRPKILAINLLSHLLNLDIISQ